jgi:hypothetical protein
MVHTGILTWRIGYMRNILELYLVSGNKRYKCSKYTERGMNLQDALSELSSLQLINKLLCKKLEVIAREKLGYGRGILWD